MTVLNAYRAYWHPLALASEVTEKPRQYTLLGEKLVAFRSGTEFAVLKDVCIHRGAALSLGQVVNGAIECPYHGWQYGANGRCVRIPALPPESPIPVKAQCTSYRVRVVGDVVWVALEEPRAPFPEWPQGTGDGTPDVRYLIVNCYEWNVDAGRAVENFLDVAHFPFIHEGTLGTRDKTLVAPYEVTSGDHWLKFSYPQEEPADPSTGHGELMDLQYSYHAPFTVHLKRQTPHKDWSVMSLLASPTTATSSRLFITFSRNFDLAPASDSVYTNFTEVVMNEDKDIVQSVRPEEIPVDVREELHMRIPDQAGVIFRRILSSIQAQHAQGVIAITEI
jgi:phenylpropionate dioxygenase-like ring-hydroxylating dioxygenase large terminal subunit